jgi:hypothetical protein
MKKILLLLLLFFSCTISFAQQTEKKTIHVTTGSHLKKFLKNSANQKLTILPTTNYFIRFFKTRAFKERNAADHYK